MTTINLPSQEETERYIRRCTDEWAAVGVTGDASPLGRILADDYEGVSARGDVRDKAAVMVVPAGPPPLSASQVEYANFRHFGNLVITQGTMTLTLRDARQPPLRLIWTDVWMFRNGAWQVVASQDSVRPPIP